MAEPYTRVDLPGLGRSLCDKPGDPGRVVIIARDDGYDVTSYTGTMRVRDFAGAPLGWHRAHPTDEDLAWLRGASGAGRPTKEPEDARRHRVRVYLDDAEVADLDSRRGSTSRSEWMARETGLRR